MKMQNYEQATRNIRDEFAAARRKRPERFRRRLNLSWSNWGFGMENLKTSAARLEKAGILHIELHGNHYGPDLGYRAGEIPAILNDHGIAAAGVCGMFSADNDLSSNRPHRRQAAVDYLKREIDFAAAVGAGYLLVVPGAVGRPHACDDAEFERSVATLRLVADRFVQAGIRGAVEPIRSAEVSFCHTVADARRYLAAVDHPGVAHINGDVFHMLNEENHVGAAIVEAGPLLVNLHLADSNRRAPGEGEIDLDTVIMALYLIGFNRDGCYVTPEPLGPGCDPYPAMNGIPDSAMLDRMVLRTAEYFREREEEVRCFAEMD